MATRRVKFYDAFKGGGFIVPDDGSKDIYIYIHSKEVKEAGLDSVAPRQAVSYDTKKEGNHRIVAVNIRLLSS